MDNYDQGLNNWVDDDTISVLGKVGFLRLYKKEICLAALYSY